MTGPNARCTPALLFAAALLGLFAGCADDEPPAAEPLFPADYAGSYSEVRNCRQSGDHNLNIIRVLASPDALAPYQDRDQPFFAGAVVLKEEYDFGDSSCSGPIKQWTVMVKQAQGSAPAALDWKWQQVDAQRNVDSEDAAGCINCHSGCTDTSGGYDYTCTVP